MNTNAIAGISKFRRIRALITLFCAFVAAASLGGLLNVTTPLGVLINIALAISMPSTAGVFAAVNVFIVIFGTVVLVSNFSSFAALENSPNMIVLASMAIGGYIWYTTDIPTALTVIAVMLPPALFVRLTLKKLSYKWALTFNMLYFLLLILLSVGFYFIENRMEGLTLSELISSNFPEFISNYSSFVEEPLGSYSMALITTGSTLTPESALGLLMNHLPALYVCSAMVLSFFSTTYCVKNSGFMPVRMSMVARGFSVSKVGAITFLLTGAAMLLTEGVNHAVFYNFFTILMLPLSLVGLNSIRSGLLKKGGMFVWMFLFMILIFMPITSVFLFFAGFGAMDILVAKKISVPK